MPAASFELLTFSEEHFFQNLGHELVGPAAVADHGRAGYLSTYLREIGARTLVVEADYTDADYLDDFAAILSAIEMTVRPPGPSRIIRMSSSTPEWTAWNTA